MRIGRYRITSRGYLVFGIVGIVVISLLMIGASRLFPESMAGVDLKGDVNQTQTTGSTVENSVNNSATSETAADGTTNQVIDNQTAGLSVEEKNKMLNEISVVVYFEPDKYELDTNFYASLSRVVDMTIRFKEASVLIEGHFNGVPNLRTTPFRTELAQNRAEMVQAYLVSQGVSPERIEIVNMGSSKPVNKDESWQEIEKNRRVEIKFKPISQPK